MRRANSMMSSTLPSFGAPAQVSKRPAVVAIVEHAEDIDVGIGLGSQRFDQLFAASIGADDDGAATEPPLARPTADHRAQQQPLGNQRREAADEKCRKPQPRYLAAELRKERNADEQQEHECPRGDQPCELPELATKHLHLVDVGSLETDHRGSGHGKDGGDIGPVKTVMANHVADIDRNADQAQHREIDDANRARDHDRGIGPEHFLVGDGKRCPRETATPFDRRSTLRCDGIHYGACVDWFHCSRSVSARSSSRARRGGISLPHGLDDKSEETVIGGKERLTGRKGVAVTREHALDHRLLGKMLEDPVAKGFCPQLRGGGVIERARDRVRHGADGVRREQRVGMGTEDFCTFPSRRWLKACWPATVTPFAAR